MSQRPSSFQDVPSNVSLTMTKGVNFSSCPDTFVKCYCEVNTVDGIMRATRLTEPCISIEGCIASNSGTFTFEGELDPGNSIDLDDVYENDDRERKLEGVNKLSSFPYLIIEKGRKIFKIQITINLIR